MNFLEALVSLSVGASLTTVVRLVVDYIQAHRGSVSDAQSLESVYEHWLAEEDPTQREHLIQEYLTSKDSE